MPNKIALFLLFSLFSSAIIAQDKDHTEHSSEDHQDHHHELDHKNHLGLALGPVYIINEEEFAPGAHLHYVRLINTKGESQFGVGLGLEAIFDEHRHYSTSLNLSYLPFHNLTLTIAPGAQFGPETTEFTTHFEVSYEFIFGEIHLGPVAEYAWAENDAHAMLGIHLGYGF